MRFTTIERLECRRLVPYNPDDHSLLDRTGHVSATVEHLEEGLVNLRLEFKTEFRKQGTGELWGLIEGQASTTIRSASVSVAVLSRKDAENMPPDLGKLIEGAFAEDIFLPASTVARGMHLPSLLIAPFAVKDFKTASVRPRNQKSAGGRQGPAEPRARRAKSLPSGSSPPPAN